MRTEDKALIGVGVFMVVLFVWVLSHIINLGLHAEQCHKACAPYSGCATDSPFSYKVRCICNIHTLVAE